MLFKKVFEKIYESEINCRLEWRWDGGFVWSIQNDEWPRIWKDDDIQDDYKRISRMDGNKLEKDWIDRGSSDTIDGAFYDMINSIEKHFPNSAFTKWVKDYNENMDHFYICQGCGDLVDMRDLGNVFEHEHNKKVPVIDKNKKYIAKREGDNKEWNDGKSIDLN